MNIYAQPALAKWQPTLFLHEVGPVKYREGVYHSPHGTVECFSQDYTVPASGLRIADEASTFTLLRMVLGGKGWEYRDDSFYEPERLARLASTFARTVADAHASGATPPLAPAVLQIERHPEQPTELVA